MVLNNVFSLEELVFIAGDYFTIEFNVLDEASASSIDLSSYTLSCVISIFGETGVKILEKSGTTTGLPQGTFQVEFTSDETINLNGKYIYQPVIEADAYHTYRPAQGILTILPAIPTS